MRQIFVYYKVAQLCTAVPLRISTDHNYRNLVRVVYLLGTIEPYEVPRSTTGFYSYPIRYRDLDGGGGERGRVINANTTGYLKRIQ
jgi:hypothetical protein